MIIFLGYTENRTKKVLLSDKHSAQIVYQIDGIDAGIYSIENAGTLLKELNDVTEIVSCDRHLMNILLNASFYQGIKLEDIPSVHSAIINSSPKEVQDDNMIEARNEVKLKKKEDEQLVYANKQELMIDLRRHLDDVYNEYVDRHNITNDEWFNWDNALFTSANYLKPYLQRGTYDERLIIPCALVDETCEDIIKKQHEEYLQKENELCMSN